MRRSCGFEPGPAGTCGFAHGQDALRPQVRPSQGDTVHSFLCRPVFRVFPSMAPLPAVAGELRPCCIGRTQKNSLCRRGLRLLRRWAQSPCPCAPTGRGSSIGASAAQRRTAAAGVQAGFGPARPSKTGFVRPFHGHIRIGLQGQGRSPDGTAIDCRRSFQVRTSDAWH